MNPEVNTSGFLFETISFSWSLCFTELLVYRHFALIRKSVVWIFVFYRFSTAVSTNNGTTLVVEF